MTIKKLSAGAHGKKPRYLILDDDGGMLVWFDQLEQAAKAYRYLMGAPVSGEEQAEACEIIRRFDGKGVTV